MKSHINFIIFILGTIPIPPEFQIPRGVDFGQISESNIDVITNFDFFDLKPGLMCEVCFSPCPTLSKWKLDNSKKCCKSCAKGRFSGYTRKVISYEILKLI